MGRAVLVAVILLTSLYAGILLNVQKNLFKLPTIIAENFLQKEAENLSDYALRSAVRDANSILVIIPTDGSVTVKRSYSNYRINHCQIDSIKWRFVTDRSHYLAKTYVSGAMQGMNIKYNAEIAFSFPVVAVVPWPDGIYYRCDQPQFHGSNEYVLDESGNNNEGAAMNGMGTRPKGQGVDGWKCASFDGTNDYISCPDNNPSTRVDSTFTLSVFGKIDYNEVTACVMWLASDPYDNGAPNGIHPGDNLRYKPTAGIWYTSTPTKQMHFACTLINKYVLQIDVPYVPSGRNPYNFDPWNHFAITFNKGIMKAYINGSLVGTTGTLTSLLWKKTLRNDYGITFARRQILLGDTPQADFYYLTGVLDQLGLYRRALTDAEISAVYWGMINKANILYLRD